MNRAVDFTALSLITSAAIARARGDAARTRRSALAVLEESTGLDPEVLIAALGSVLHFSLIDMTALNEATPAFDQLPYEEAVRRECVALRDRDGIDRRRREDRLSVASGQFDARQLRRPAGLAGWQARRL